MKNKKFKINILIILLAFVLITVSCDFNNENTIKIISIDPIEGLTAGVPQLFTIEVEYTLSTDDSGYVWISFNSDNKAISINPNPYNFITSESFSIKKGSGKITFKGTETPIDWSAYNTSFFVMAALSANNDGMLGDLSIDKKEILK